MVRSRIPGLAAVACAVLVARLAAAHLLPPDLPFYGPFGAPTARCQRALGRAAQRCFRRVLAAQRQCLDTELVGGSCDVSSRDAEIAAAKQAGEDSVVQACLGGQLTELRFI